MVRDIPFLWWFLFVPSELFCVAWTYELPCQAKLPEFYYITIVCCTRVFCLVLQPLGLELDKVLFGWNSVNMWRDHGVDIEVYLLVWVDVEFDIEEFGEMGQDVE